MRFINALMAIVLSVIFSPSFVFAQGSPEPPYVETTNDAGKTVILKRDFSAEEQVQVESLAGCLAFNSSASGGYLLGGTSVVAYSYTTSCAGPHSGSGLTKTPSTAYVRITLEKLISGVWTPVATGVSYSYSGTAGQYRILINNLGSITAKTWSFNYQLPI